MDDISLMAQVIAGEIDKTGLLYEKYKKPLFAYFYKFTCGDSMASEDLVHTVFYRVIRYRTSFTGEGNFAKWLFRIAHNAGIDHARKTIKVHNYNQELSAIRTTVYENIEMEKNEQLAILHQAMFRLKPDERELLVLSKIDCLKYREIAEILNLTESNVKIRVFRALKKLKDIYSKLENTIYEKSRPTGKDV
ncbi:MAG: RNA polymerase sigma factor [Bacteroidota bacterium]